MKGWFFFFFISGISTAYSQQNVGIGTASPDPSALLEIKSATKGMLPPRMTFSQVQAIANPAEGLLAYDSTTHVLRMYNGSEWVALSQKKGTLSDAPGQFVNGITSAGTGLIYPEGMDLGPDNSIYITGYFTGSVSIAGQSVNSLGSSDIFFLKILPNGTLGWLRSIGGTGSDEANDITVDNDGSCIIVGHFETTVDFDPGAGIQNLTNAGGGDAFYARYAANGNWVWSKAIGGTGYDRAYAVDISGTFLYITGYFIGTGATFNPTVLNSNSLDMFLCRYQVADGNLGAGGWVKQMGGAGSQSGYDIKVQAGLVHVGGYFANTTDFGGTSLLSAGGFDGFFARYYLGGTLYDVYGISGLGNQYVRAINVDATGNIFCGGNFTETGDFDPGQGVASLSSFTNTTYDGFVAKYTAAGIYAWAKKFGSSENDIVENLITRSNGDVLSIGSVYFSAVFVNGSSPAFSLTAAGSSDALLVCLDGNGKYKWGQLAGGLADDEGMDIIMGPGQSILLLSRIGSDPSLDFQGSKSSGGLGFCKYYE